MMELLAPAGSMEAVTAAVQNGAGAVYFGFGDFNARRGAKNFSEEEAAAAVSYCHLRGCKVHITLNTLVTDRELPRVVAVASHASRIGADAAIVQDLGLARMLRHSVPDLPLHGSTQMTIHSLDGVKACADLGMTRVVLARELRRDQIEHICTHSPIEIEVFAHGALCMSWSGQCFFSSVLGGRSGNRGMCAQPCRLRYGINEKLSGRCPLSLKDLTLVNHLKELQEMGVASLKLEGRMKRPEYVAIVTRIFAQALREQREPTPEEMTRLEQVFSRQGFTDGYFTGKLGQDMFGFRDEQTKEPRELYLEARATYENGENRKEPVRIYAMVKAGERIQVAIQDAEGRTAYAEGSVPEQARNVPLTREKVEAQMSRTGGTPFAAEKTLALVEEGLSVPLSELNRLRREALEDLSEQRQALPKRRQEPFRPGVRYANQKEPPVFTVSVREVGQISADLLRLKPALLYVPAAELASHPELPERCYRAGVPLAALLPRICTDREQDALEKDLLTLLEMGVNEALVGTLGIAERAKALGFRLRGDFGLGVFNSQTLKELRRMGFLSATASFELRLPQLRDLSKPIPVEFIAYGRFPLMITENCIIHTQTGEHLCANVNHLRDRRGERFPILKAWGCRNEIYNAKMLFMADKARDWLSLGLWGARLMFTTENALECTRIMERYLGKNKFQPNDYTRGLYYREVE